MSLTKNPLIKNIVISALKEDIGKRDITTEAIAPGNKPVKAVILAKEECVVCGMYIANLAFKLRDKNVRFASFARDGDFVKRGTEIGRVRGRAASVLSAERVALNFLSLLSGVSTKTKQFVEAVKPFRVKIVDTRKTIPGLRFLQKYAVRTGGGYNHRMRLDEMFLVKDNHLKITGNLANLRLKNKNYKSEIEVKNLSEFKEALKLTPDIIMLDNMDIKEMKEAVRIRNSLRKTRAQAAPKIEASGGVTLKTVRKIAACGVDLISIGELTHSVKSVDMSLEVM